ncbi:MAG: hypothetical protein Q8R92_15935 [Deltaproteobacteria bacterium]|nr:hypothetical protein [Deltaproteobacteria bacterium]
MVAPSLGVVPAGDAAEELAHAGESRPAGVAVGLGREPGDLERPRHKAEGAGEFHQRPERREPPVDGRGGELAVREVGAVGERQRVRATRRGSKELRGRRVENRGA